MNKGKVIICLVAVATFGKLSFADSQEYQPVGPSETAALERELRARMAGYNCAFWPRTEKLSKAVPGQSLPKKYTDSIIRWIPEVLRAEFLPKKLVPMDWLGVRKLYFNRNCIIGRFSPADCNDRSGNDPNSMVQFKARYRGLDLTIDSETVFARPAREMTAEKLKELIPQVLNIPAEKIGNIRVKSRCEKLAGVEVCYGKIFCEWTENSSPFEVDRRWWSYIPFWYVRGKLFASITTVDKGDLPHASIKERWRF